MRVRWSRASLVTSILALVLPAALSAGCTSSLPPLISQAAPIQGQGDLSTEARTVADFERISVSGGVRVVVATGSSASVGVSAQANLLSLVSTDVTGGQLVVTVRRPGFASTQPVTLTIVAPALRSISLSGGASGTLEVTGTDLAIDVSGGASLEASGRVRQLALTGSSGARANLGELAADGATVTLTDGADVVLNVANSLTGTAGSGSTVRLTRRPATLDVTTSSGGSVEGG